MRASSGLRRCDELCVRLRYGAVVTASSAASSSAAGSLIDVGNLRLRAEHLRPLSIVARAPRGVLKGHLVGFPRRAVGRLAELRDEELVDLMECVRSAQRCVGGAWNIAIKDGAASGMPISHLHVHAVPRCAGDLKMDEIFERIRVWSPIAGAVHDPPKIKWPAELERVDRTLAAMAGEAQGYAAAARTLGLLDSDDAATTPPRDHTFGPHTIPASTVFLRSPTALSVAFVNLRPLLPGHVLVSPRRVVAQLSELSAAEAADLWRTVRSVQRVVEMFHGADAADLGVQDGKIAGQSVPHVHVHIIPRC